MSLAAKSTTQRVRMFIVCPRGQLYYVILCSQAPVCGTVPPADGHV